MDLTHGELAALKRQNQRIKALGNGEVTVVWKEHRIVRIAFVASLSPTDIYSPEGTPAPGQKQKVEGSD